MLMLVREMQEEGKSKIEIVDFLKSRMGFSACSGYVHGLDIFAGIFDSRIH